MRDMKNTKCQLLSIEERLAITNTANATSNIPRKKISEQLCACVNLKYAARYSNSASKQLSLNKGENSDIQKCTIILYVAVPRKKALHLPVVPVRTSSC